jgi:hypothetical protein
VETVGLLHLIALQVHCVMHAQALARLTDDFTPRTQLGVKRGDQIATEQDQVQDQVRITGAVCVQNTLWFTVNGCNLCSDLKLMTVVQRSLHALHRCLGIRWLSEGVAVCAQRTGGVIGRDPTLSKHSAMYTCYKGHFQLTATLGRLSTQMNSNQTDRDHF